MVDIRKKKEYKDKETMCKQNKRMDIEKTKNSKKMKRLLKRERKKETIVTIKIVKANAKKDINYKQHFDNNKNILTINIKLKKGKILKKENKKYKRFNIEKEKK